jgi:hypothetical protein
LCYKIAKGKYVVHFSDGCRALPGWIDNIVPNLEDHDVGLALFAGQPYEAGRSKQTIYHGTLNGQPQDYPVAHWFCARRDFLAQIYFMDEGYNF